MIALVCVCLRACVYECVYYIYIYIYIYIYVYIDIYISRTTGSIIIIAVDERDFGDSSLFQLCESARVSLRLPHAPARRGRGAGPR